MVCYNQIFSVQSFRVRVIFYIIIFSDSNSGDDGCMVKKRCFVEFKVLVKITFKKNILSKQVNILKICLKYLLTWLLMYIVYNIV